MDEKVEVVEAEGEEKLEMDSKFRMVLIASGRAEQLMRGARPKIEVGKRKATRVALDELSGGLIDWGYGPAPKPEPEEQAAEEQPAGEEVH
jgi:DNA-directed RNA polymerase subunit K/omega